MGFRRAQWTWGRVALPGLLALGVALLAPASSQVFAAEPTSLDRARAGVSSSVGAWETAKREQDETRSRFDALEHRINALKRIRAKSPSTFTGDAELERLLRQSIDAEAALKSAHQTLDARAGEVRTNVLAAIALVDARIKELLPKLKQGALEDRKAAARTINELRALRRELGATAAHLAEANGTPQSWARYDVQIDPLDGPPELGEKADLLEDTRERLERKRSELSRLIRDAREEQEISRVSSQFRTDTRLFDEEAVNGRVTRQERSSASPTVLQTASDKTAGSNPPSRSAGDSNPAPAQTPGTGFGGTQQTPPPSPPPAQQGGGAAENNADSAHTQPQTPANPQTAGESTFRSAEPSAPISKQIDANVLLNLRVEALDGKSVDLATLEALSADLDKLDQFLAHRAEQIRKRAKQLKEDEAHATSGK